MIVKRDGDIVKKAIKKKIIRPTYTILKYESDDKKTSVLNKSTNTPTKSTIDTNKTTIDNIKSMIVPNVVDNSVESVENIPKDEYKFELVSYGYVSDTVIYTDKEKAIRFFLFNNNSFDFILRLYINGERVPIEKARTVLGITKQIEYNYNKSISRSYI